MKKKFIGKKHQDTPKDQSLRPDEPKPQRPMQPVFEPAPEPDPKFRVPRPETNNPAKQTKRMIEEEQERLERAKNVR